MVLSMTDLGMHLSSDIAINGSFIALIGDLSNSTAEKEVNAEGMAVAPGFINVLSWATQPLIIDGRAMSDIKQGVTLEIMGEGRSMGPLNESMKIREKIVNPILNTISNGPL